MRTRATAGPPVPWPDCPCNCGCDPDGDWHFNGDAGCQCVRQKCSCVTDEPGKPTLLSNLD